MQFADVLKQNRTRKCKSLAELSTDSGIPVSTIHNYEKGVQPTLEKADAILKALDISLVIGKQDPGLTPEEISTLEAENERLEAEQDSFKNDKAMAYLIGYEDGRGGVKCDCNKLEIRNG